MDEEPLTFEQMRQILADLSREAQKNGAFRAEARADVDSLYRSILESKEQSEAADARIREESARRAAEFTQSLNEWRERSEAADARVREENAQGVAELRQSLDEWCQRSEAADAQIREESVRMAGVFTQSLNEWRERSEAADAQIREENARGTAELREENARGTAELREENARGTAELREENARGIAELRGENARGIAELRGENARGIAELREENMRGEAELRQTLAESRARGEQGEAELRRSLQNMQKEIGGLANKFGSFTEGLALPSVKHILTEIFECDSISIRHRFGAMSGRHMEIDVLGVSEKLNCIVVVEVKSHLSESELQRTVVRMGEFFEFAPQHKDRKLFGIILYISAPDEAVRHAVKLGFYIAQIHDDAFRLNMPPEFLPRTEWPRDETRTWSRWS